MIQEKSIRPLSGWFPLVVCLGLLIGGPSWFVYQLVLYGEKGVWLVVFVVPTIACGVITALGFQAVPPNAARALLLFGEYVGSITESGFFWVNPFYSKKKISLRVRNFETGSVMTTETKDAAGRLLQHKSRTSGRPSKVNDRDGRLEDTDRGLQDR